MWLDEDAKCWAELPEPETLPALLNHSGTNAGSLLSITNTEHHQSNTKKSCTPLHQLQPQVALSHLFVSVTNLPALPCTTHHSSITPPNFTKTHLPQNLSKRKAIAAIPQSNSIQLLHSSLSSQIVIKTIQPSQPNNPLLNPQKL